jgi:replicative DNA helicase
VGIDENLRRVPPQSLEAEESVLGGVLLENGALDRVIELLRPEDFYRSTHRKIFRAMLELAERTEPVDLITLSETLKASNDLADVGGTSYLAELAERVPTAANVVHYARIVRDRSLLRNLIGAATDIASRGYDADGDVSELLDQAERSIFNITERQIRSSFSSIGDVLVGSLKTIERLYEQKQAVTGVASGFQDLDRLTAGLQPSDLIIIAGRPSMGKCLTADAEILLSDGSVATIEDVYRARAGRLLTLDDQWQFAPAEPSAFVDDGIKPVYEVTTRLGRQIRTTGSHPFLTIAGWQPIVRLRPGDHVAVPRRLPVFGAASLGEERVRLLAYLLSDSEVDGPSLRFSRPDERLRADLRQAVESFGGLAVREELQPQGSTLVITAAEAGPPRSGPFGGALGRHGSIAPAVWEHEDAAPGTAHPLVTWLAALGTQRKWAGLRFIPPVVFTLRRPEMALFLNRLFAVDGSAGVQPDGQPQIGFTSSSERLARQLQHLLLRFGIVASLRSRRIRHRGTLRTAFQLDITDAPSIRSFLDDVGMLGHEDALARVAAALDPDREQAGRDVVPSGVWRRIEATRGEVSWRTVAARMGLEDAADLEVGRSALSRVRLLRLADALGDRRLRALATSDVYWDEIVSIRPVGSSQVYDLTIPDTHNFVANDVCVHNTAFALNLAENAALRSDVGVAVFSLEMSKEQLALRMLCSEARVDLARVRTGHLSDREFPTLAMAAGRLADAPIYIDDTPALSVLELRAKARRLKRDPQSKLGLVIVDYIQLMRSAEGRDSREQEISEISRSLKALAKELSVPVVALSQLNRQVENRHPPIPRLADLRESGAIEQDADVILFLYREEYYDPDSDKKGVAEVLVAKQRNGPIGSVDLTFLREITRFENREIAPDEAGEAAPM